MVQTKPNTNCVTRPKPGDDMKNARALLLITALLSTKSAFTQENAHNSIVGKWAYQSYSCQGVGAQEVEGLYTGTVEFVTGSTVSLSSVSFGGCVSVGNGTYNLTGNKLIMQFYNGIGSCRNQPLRSERPAAQEWTDVSVKAQELVYSVEDQSCKSGLGQQKLVRVQQ